MASHRPMQLWATLPVTCLIVPDTHMHTLRLIHHPTPQFFLEGSVTGSRLVPEQQAGFLREEGGRGSSASSLGHRALPMPLSAL